MAIELVKPGAARPSTQGSPYTPAHAGSAAAQLQAAKDLLSRADVWIQGAYARDSEGRPIDTHNQRATCFCSTGALYATEDPTLGSLKARLALRAVVGTDLEIWNDAPDRTLVEVLDAFDRAIAHANAGNL